MGLLDQHVSQLKSEEIVLGVSAPWYGKDKQAGMESTGIEILARPGGDWTGFRGVLQKVKDARIGEAMKGKQFPARCFVTYERQPGTMKSTYEGQASVKEVELLVVVGIEYICPLDVIELKIPPEKKAA